MVNALFEGDIVRPLGVVTLHFGYAEYELDSFIESLAVAGLTPKVWRQRPIGAKLKMLKEIVKKLDPSVQSTLETLLDDVRILLAQRNSLIHGCLLSGGRIVSGRTDIVEKRTSVEELESLAEKIFNWKERLWACRWKQIEPLLKKAND